MIANERQYAVTKAQADRFRTSLDQIDEAAPAGDGATSVLVAAQRSALAEQLADLESDLLRYEKLRAGGVRQLQVDGIADIGSKLIEARIVQGLSQRELGERLGMREQQIQRYEQERYLSANLTRCAEIADALDVDLSAHLEVRRRRA